jgi:hypothetical protein
LGIYLLSTISLFTLLWIAATTFLTKIDLHDTVQFLEMFVSGYGGLVDKPSVTAIFCVFFAVHALLRGIYRVRIGILSKIDAYQAAIGTMILVWMPYYVNRMHEWNLWFHTILLLLLFTPRIGPAALRFLVRRSHFGAFYVGLAGATICGFMLMSVERLIDNSNKFLRSVTTECDAALIEMAGLCVAGDDGRRVAAKLQILREIRERQDYLVLSLLPTQIRLLRFNDGFPWYEPFSEIPRPRDLSELVAWIQANGPRYILIDNPDSTIARRMVLQTQHLQAIAGASTAYRKIRTGPEWILYQRHPGNEG